MFIWKFQLIIRNNFKKSGGWIKLVFEFFFSNWNHKIFYVWDFLWSVMITVIMFLLCDFISGYPDLLQSYIFFYILTSSHTSLTCWISACFKNPFTSCVNLCNFSYAFWIIFPPLVLNWSLLCCAVALSLTSTLLQYSSFSIQFSFLFFPLCHCSASVKVGRYSKVHC